MASILRQIVAGPRSRHPEAGLDLCYVTDFIVVTSGPSSTYPQRAYRNPTDSLVKWLDYKHGADWAIWEFRAEGTGYPDSEVYGRIRHFPWPDHHPPPFHLIPNIMASMRNWLREEEGEEKEGEPPPGEKTEQQWRGGGADTLSPTSGGGRGGGAAAGGRGKRKRVVVVHCKAGKGRSGTVACSYLISEEGWKAADALARFTARRMRPGFGPGVSIPSQVRWVGYVDRWANRLGKVYVERPVEIVEVRVWGLREGVRVSLQGFLEDGRKIASMHVFDADERYVLVDGGGGGGGDGGAQQGNDGLFAKLAGVSLNSDTLGVDHLGGGTATPSPTENGVESGSSSSRTETTGESTSTTPTEGGLGRIVVFRPKTRVLLPTSDVCISLQRRKSAPYYSWAVVTSVAHVWFNVFFEGLLEQIQSAATSTVSPNSSGQSAASPPSSQPGADKQTGPGQGQAHKVRPADSGVFEIDWDSMDGLKGSSRKGARALDRLAVAWRAVGDAPAIPLADGISEPAVRPGKQAADAGGAVTMAGGPARIILQPQPGEKVPEPEAADWKQGTAASATAGSGEIDETPSMNEVSKIEHKAKGLMQDGVRKAGIVADAMGVGPGHKAAGGGGEGAAAANDNTKNNTTATHGKSKSKRQNPPSSSSELEAGDEGDSDESLKGVRTHGMASEDEDDEDARRKGLQ